MQTAITTGTHKLLNRCTAARNRRYLLTFRSDSEPKKQMRPPIMSLTDDLKLCGFVTQLAINVGNELRNRCLTVPGAC